MEMMSLKVKKYVVLKRKRRDSLLARLVKADYSTLVENEHLDTTPDIEKLILLQSVEGHAHNGHGAFHKRRFVNLSTADVVRILGLDEEKVKRERQSLIDEIFEWVDGALKEEQKEQLVNPRGEPFIRIPFLANYQVEPADVLRGIYLGGKRDKSEIREQVENKFGVSIGGGSCYLVNTRVMRKMGLNAEDLASGAYEKEINDFHRRGLIVDKHRSVDDDLIRYLYIRHRIGPGHSDDSAVVSAGLLWGRDVALGVFLADAIDTLEKYSYKYEDQDGDLAEYIGCNFSRLDVDKDKLYTLTYLATVQEGKEEGVPDSSLRYMLSIDRKTNITMLQSHLNFVEGKSYIPINTGHHRISTDEFYEYISRRVMDFTKAKLPRDEELLKVGPPLSSALEKNFASVSVKATVDDVAKAMVKGNTDIAVVFDGKGKVVGVVRGSKLIPFLTERE